MRIGLKLRGTDALGNPFEEVSSTQNVSAEGFLCECSAPLAIGAVLDVFLVSGNTRFIGKARVIRQHESGGSSLSYAFRLVEKNSDWILQT